LIEDEESPFFIKEFEEENYEEKKSQKMKII
jgi:hypothetical protein